MYVYVLSYQPIRYILKINNILYFLSVLIEQD